jgi:shikimate dehydrogenase
LEPTLPSTSSYAVIGDPVEHSVSPQMQAAAFRASGIDADFRAIHVRREDLPSWVRAAPSTFAGFNITIPHKEAMLELVDDVSSDARLVGAVNTVACRDGVLAGYNTDLNGMWALLDSLQFEVTGRPTVVFGAGGSSRAVVAALAARGATVTVVNQTVSRAEALSRGLQARSMEVSKPAATPPSKPPELRAVASGSKGAFYAVSLAVLMVNCTPLGMAHLRDQTPLPDGVSLDHQPVVIDLVYGGPTALVRRAWRAGCQTFDGIEMLVQQGGASFRIWTGKVPDLDAMRQACRDALEAR